MYVAERVPWSTLCICLHLFTLHVVSNVLEYAGTCMSKFRSAVGAWPDQVMSLLTSWGRVVSALLYRSLTKLMMNVAHKSENSEAFVVQRRGSRLHCKWWWRVGRWRHIFDTGRHQRTAQVTVDITVYCDICDFTQCLQIFSYLLDTLWQHYLYCTTLFVLYVWFVSFDNELWSS